MDETDRQLLDLLQDQFPLVERPYRELGRRLGLSEDEVIRRVAELKRANVVRRIGATFEPRRLGYVSTLVACRVPEDRVDDFARVVSEYPEVTHNYEREHDYNVWFTVIAPSGERLNEIIENIKRETGVSELHSLPAVRVHKINVTFDLRGRHSP
ncbi:MAG: AsnC family transcriptional regulator [Armatimonadota bacterium]